MSCVVLHDILTRRLAAWAFSGVTIGDGFIKEHTLDAAGLKLTCMILDAGLAPSKSTT